jgi:lactoylglutathione lyase
MNKHHIIFLILLGSLVLPIAGWSQDTLNDSTMNEKILGLRTCLYKVPNLDEAKKWYADAFGVKPYFDEPFYVGFDIGGFELGLLPTDGEKAANAENVVCYWGVEHVEQTFKEFIELGAEVHEEPHSVGEPLIVASVRDPWGNVIGFIYNPVFKVK